MQLAHDLQMKLLPNAEHIAPQATVAARVVPAEDVGGDFYNLYRLSNERIGIMIGDVSGHGYQAALIMALTMSASAIHAQGTDDPAEMLRRLYQSVKEELTTTEMFVSALYAVIDRNLGVLRYGNTGILMPSSSRVTATWSVSWRAAAARHVGRCASLGGSPVGRRWRSAPAVHRRHHRRAQSRRIRLSEEPVLDCVMRLPGRETARFQIATRVFARYSITTPATRPASDDLTLVILKS
jgi:hypothetical protein